MGGMFSLFWLRENTSAHVDALADRADAEPGKDMLTMAEGG